MDNEAVFTADEDEVCVDAELDACEAYPQTKAYVLNSISHDAEINPISENENERSTEISLDEPADIPEADVTDGQWVHCDMYCAVRNPSPEGAMYLWEKVQPQYYDGSKWQWYDVYIFQKG